MVETRFGRSSSRSLERLAKDLAVEAQISFDEHRAFLFAQKAKTTIGRTRLLYRDLVKNLNEYMQSTQGTEVLLDNFYIVDSTLTELLVSWKQKITLRVPQSKDAEGEVLPRVYIIARALVKETDVVIDRNAIVEFLKAYQKSAPLSVRELDIFPSMLRFVLTEEISRLVESNLFTLREMSEADRWYTRISNAARRKDAPFQLKKFTAMLSREYAIIPQAFGLHLLHRLAQMGKNGDMRVVSKWLKLSLSKQGATASQLATINACAARRQATTVSNAIASLRYLTQVRWDKISLELNMVNAVLAKDPAGAFLLLTDETRSQYQQTIARIADSTSSHDIEVAREAVRLARQASESSSDDAKRRAHVGYYFVDDGVFELEHILGYVPTVIEKVRAYILKNSAHAYLGFVGVVTLVGSIFLLTGSGAMGLPLLPLLVIVIVGLVLVSEIAIAIAHFLFTRILKPRPLPALDLVAGVGASRRTFVVMPSMFRNGDSAKKLLRRLETNFIANNDPDIFYALLMDFRDAPTQTMSDDADRVDELNRGIAELNARHPSSPARFTLFYRERKWNPAEKVFMGWERKRGKLREFNELLRGKETSYDEAAKTLAAEYGYVRSIITLDEDTELVRDSAQALIGTINHPLNIPVIDSTKHIVVTGYGIIQPRTALRFHEGRASAFAHLFGNFPGIDAYSSLVSNFHQDLFGEVIFHGKGIYDIDAVEATMGGRIPENIVLSHDLLEGLYARVGIASGAHIFEGFPSNYREHMQRLHRWVRGDWQIVLWIFRPHGKDFSLIARYRIFDNLRRSLLPIAAAFAVLFSAFSASEVAVWSIVVLPALGSGQLVSAILNITGRTVDWRSSVSVFARFESLVVGFGIALAKTFLLGVFVLHNAVVTLDAILRSMWRLFVSKQNLLQWQTAYEAAEARNASVQGFVRFMWRSMLISLFCVYLEFYSGQLGNALLWMVFWLSAPFFAALISVQRKDNFIFSRKEQLYLRTIAARTYWFFLDLATKEEQWLVPDHLQEEPSHKRHSHGLGISPTNLGMYLLALSGARVVGLSSISDYCERMTRALQSMGRMRRYRGHFFNWYELKELSPLAPRYVSSVDSANLALSLRAVCGGLRDACGAQIFNANTFEGLEAELVVLLEASENVSIATTERKERKLLNEIMSATREALSLVEKAAEEDATPRRCDIVFSGIIHHAIRIRNVLETLRLEGKSERFDEIFLAARHVESTAEVYRNSISRFLGHAMVPAASSVANNTKLHALYLKLASVLQRVPSINDVAQEKVRQDIELIGIEEAIMLSNLPSPEKKRASLWYTEVLERLSDSENHAKEIARLLKDAAAKTENYAKEMDFTFLYNKERGLFHIGYNSVTETLDESFYDLFASEANSASIISIAKSDVPQKHWGYLGRKLIKSNNGDSLVASWAGSLFEYLGTLLYFDVPHESFWGVSAHRAIIAHQCFARKYRIPWGMGESASSRQDTAQNYHYQAFGEPSLGYKRDLSESIVVAPYTSALALSIAPREVLLNFAHLTEAGGFGHYGFYDAIDFTKRKRKVDRELPGVPARVYYAHHQGFILSSIVNALTGGWVRKMVAWDPGMDVITQLFEERMPEGVEGENIIVLATQVRDMKHLSQVSETRRQYLPWRAKEAVSNFISSGRYQSHITTTGAGKSRFGDVNITRVFSDMLRESAGIFFYLYNPGTQKLWSPTFMPTKDTGDKHAVSVGEQVVVFDKTSGNVSSSLLITALSDDEGELRELTLTNTGNTETFLKFGVCAELSLARNEEEFAHPNYERLFVTTETHWGGQAIVASRSDSRDRTSTIAAGFLLVCNGKLEELHAIREKEVFYGSPQSKSAPPVMTNFSRAKESTIPTYALDSVAAFVGGVRLHAHETRRISFIVLVEKSTKEVLLRLERYREPGRLHKVAERADALGGEFLMEMGISLAQATVYRTLASLLFSRAAKNGAGTTPAARPWVPALWKMSISGTRPILLLSVTSVTDLPMIRQILSCHAYFVKKGIAVDIVIFNNHSGGYLKTFEDEIDFLLHMYRMREERITSVVFHVRAEQLSEHERTAMLATATILIDAKKGSLADAVAGLERTHTQSYPSKFESIAKMSSAWHYVRLLQKRKDLLAFWNGIGGYDERAKEYVVYSEKGIRAPRPWSHLVAGPYIGFLATDRGMSFTWSRNSYDNKLTVSYNDLLSEFTSEAIYLRDEDTGACMSPLPLLGDDDAAHEIRFGEGYVIYRCHVENIEVECLMYVGEVERVKYYRIKVTNHDKKKRTFSLFGYFELLVGSLPSETQKHLSFEVRDGNIIVVTQDYRHQFLESRTFVGVVGGADEFTVSREEFLGRYGDIRDPAALKRKGLSCDESTREEPAVAVRKLMHIAPGETIVETMFLGDADEQELLSLLQQLTHKEYAEQEFTKTKEYWNKLPLPKVELPDKELTTLVNRFLPYQILTSRIHARLGFFQISGAYGYRDQLQDALAMLWWDPVWTRTHILAAAAHQFREGDVLSWWQPHNNFGARTRLSDPQLWLPYVTLCYVEFTGDNTILDEVIPYLSGDIPDKADRPSIVGVFDPSDEKSSLYEHLIRAIEHSLTSGAHGLPLMGTADWNDGMNRVGIEGAGESVWLAWFTISILDEMSVFTLERGDPDRATRYRSHAAQYREALEKFAWDGRWYRRAFTDAGALVGTSGAKAFRLDSVTQSWAYFTNGATKETREALQSAKDELFIYEGHVPLAWPPSSRSVLDLGTISDYPPGVRENASQYNHAALWLAQALFASGDSDSGKIIVDAVNPLKRSETMEKLSVYQGEPYVVAAEIYSTPTYPGRAGWTWYTASAGVLYRTVLEYVLGLKREGNILSFAPSFPSGWESAKVTLPFGESSYSIAFAMRSDLVGKIAVTLDGAEVAGGVLLLHDDGKVHEVIVAFGKLATSIVNIR
ncbi:MAG: glucoamylase family protein [bacterium]|nr:glucoamylase family protein [bacterium]